MVACPKSIGYFNFLEVINLLLKSRVIPKLLSKTAQYLHGYLYVYGFAFIILLLLQFIQIVQATCLCQSRFILLNQSISFPFLVKFPSNKRRNITQVRQGTYSIVPWYCGTRGEFWIPILSSLHELHLRYLMVIRLATRLC